ncbi:MAG: SseB family protein [Kofleriaceae bacterium]|nr:SseB family protein [Myxococcales bacterium]MCB9562267.1 SseB family protein [Kofleriaceae bacterium]
MSATPLSDAITEVLQGQTPALYARFLEVFARSRLGVIVHGLAAGADGTVMVLRGEARCAMIKHPDGRGMVLACSDREVFVTRFDRPFNAELDAAELMKVALHNPDCAGILINNATSEHSIVVERATIERLVAAAAAAGPDDAT